MVSYSDVREKIVRLLVDHPEGLPILSIARLVELHRHTITKYVYELVGAEVIGLRSVGSAKVCFLKEKFLDKQTRESWLKKIRGREK